MQDGGGVAGLNAVSSTAADANNQPHVGGNTWAGGTGGADTAGLGGKGGPYRIDSGHQIHQVPDEQKAQISEEAKKVSACELVCYT